MKALLTAGFIALSSLAHAAPLPEGVLIEQQLNDSALKDPAYLLYLPKGYAANPDKRWPLVVFLHGRGEWGNLQRMRQVGLPGWLNDGGELPALVLAPLSPAGEMWQPVRVDAMLRAVEQHYRIDNTRISLTGLSMGGIGSWSMALAYPQRFSALAPIAGAFYNDMATDSMNLPPSPAAEWLAVLPRIRQLPTRIYHGSDDVLVLPELGERTASLLRAAGGAPAFTVYPHVGHDAWSQTYAADEFRHWLISQQNPAPSDATASDTLSLYPGHYGKANTPLQADVQIRDGHLHIDWQPSGDSIHYVPLGEGRFIGEGLIRFIPSTSGTMQLLLPGFGTIDRQP